MPPRVQKSHHDSIERILTPRGRPYNNINEARNAAADAESEVNSRIRFAILNAITHEHAAIMAVFGKPQMIPDRKHAEHSIRYVCVKHANGGDSYVALSGISGQGIAQAAAAAAQIKFKCRNVGKIVLVGIAAGQPNLIDKEKDIRLGDIVVGEKIIQYDHIKLTDDNVELRGDGLVPGDAELLMTVSYLRSFQDFRGQQRVDLPWQKHIEVGIGVIRSADRPSKEKDPNYTRREYKKGLEQQRLDNEPFVHTGTIGSASTLLKHSGKRDKLNQDYGTIAYEMEGAGLAIAAAASGVGYLMVRGICDYGDKDKNDEWQTYASVCAASFAKSIIEHH